MNQLYLTSQRGERREREGERGKLTLRPAPDAIFIQMNARRTVFLISPVRSLDTLRFGSTRLFAR
jgi:hypothetical protein